MATTRHHFAALDDQDESVRIAVRALGDMRNSIHTSPTSSFQPTPALSATSRSSSPSLPSPSIGGESIEDVNSPDFVSRVSHIPIVNSALKAYEQSKASSRVVKYGAEMMESSVKTISRPVIDRLPVNQLDEFACRQLDRFGSYSRRPESPEASQSRSRSDVASDDYNLRDNFTSEPQVYDKEERGRAGWTSALRNNISSVRDRGRHMSPDTWKGKDRDVSMTRDDLSATSSAAPESHSRTPTPRQENGASSDNQQVAQRSRWQTVLLEAGGIGAAVSEESMRRLQYCLQWLQYATQHIDTQIVILRDFIASLQHPPSSASSEHDGSSEHLHTLTAIRRDVVDTIRQVVDVVSKYAGGALPEPARTRVRTFILCLPQRWAQAASSTTAADPGTGGKSDGKVKTEHERVGRGGRTAPAPYSYGPGEAGPSPRSRPASRATSPSSSRTSHSRQVGTAHVGTASMTQAAQRILTLATESLDMLRAVTQVFKDSLDKADAWVERLRVVGLQRPTLPPPSSLVPPPPPHSTSPSSRSPPSSPSFHSASSHHYREPLPPISLATPDSSNAPSPSSGVSPYPFSQIQLPPLGPLAFPSSSSHKSTYHQVEAASQFGEMSLTGRVGGGRNGIITREREREREGDGWATPRNGSISGGLPSFTQRDRNSQDHDNDDGGDGGEDEAAVKQQQESETRSTKMEVDG